MLVDSYLCDWCTEGFYDDDIVVILLEELCLCGHCIVEGSGGGLEWIVEER